MPSGVTVSQAKKGGDKVADMILDKAYEKNVARPTEKTKNVSHVPCKFFRQSMCQAGDKCPFSHELESDSQAVCKYFQRGNCRFGSKCALAHITPDGRRVNKKAVKEPKKKEKGKDERKFDKPYKEETESGTDTFKVHGSTPLISSRSIVQPVSSPGALLESPHKFPITTASSSLKSKTGSDGSLGSDTTIGDSSVEVASQILSKYSSSGSSPPQMRNGQAFTVRSFSANLPRNSWGGLSLGVVEDSAVYDDDDTIEEQEYNDTEEEEEGYREQLVPSTLQDLLTPLERERRNSRNSHQKSGRVFSSPASSAQPANFGIRRGSTSSEPMNGSSNTLWGPRTPVAPFYRPSQFGSPPVSSSYLASPGLSSPHQKHSTFQSAYYTGISPASVPAVPQSVAMFSSATPYISSSQRVNMASFSPSGTPSNVGGLQRPFQQPGHAVPTEKM